ncbi:TPA: DGQHR domain-containing protein [Vibrio vulnificus]|uniref:DGQHR domain-containing protein n=1 Tax=Vibrio vulnificus TaxID=672 RepID=A0A8H9K6P2_VIBVL|nr:DNA sulfur modification protein DndB [Vibrio vulnificus]HAS8538252.1 DGQHR domain-containing protein [Vibrio vulnificus]
MEKNTITSNVDHPLVLVGDEIKEGVNIAHPSIQIIVGTMTYRDYIEHFSRELPSDILSEKLKCQRDTNKARAKKVGVYLIERTDSTLPDVTLHVNQISELARSSFGGANLLQFEISPLSSRLIGDGQHRHWGIEFGKEILEENGGDLDDLLNRRIGYKMFVTNTEHIQDCAPIIKQIFADYHLNVSKPTSSLSASFDMADPFNRLIAEVAGSVKIGDNTLDNHISSSGTIKQGQLWTREQYTAFITTASGMTKTAIRKLAKSPEDFEKFKKSFSVLTSATLSNLPLSKLMDEEFSHDKALFTKALFAKGLGYFVLSAKEQMSKHQNPEMFKNNLESISKLPLNTMDHDMWLDSGITVKTESPKGLKVKITPKSDKMIAQMLCSSASVFPCKALLA